MTLLRFFSRDPVGRLKEHRRVLPLAVGALIGAAVLAVCVGRYPLDPLRVGGIILHGLHLRAGEGDSLGAAVVFQARLPRLLAAMLVGSTLSCGGAVYQGVCRNPLVSPELLGVLSGSAFGAALAIVMGLSPALVQAGAFGGGVLAVTFGLWVARMLPEGGILTLMLGGLIGNAIFTSLLSMVKYLADPLDQLPAIVTWLLGSLSGVGWGEIVWLGPVLLVLSCLLVLSAPVLDVLSLGDDEARSLGVRVSALRVGLILLATLACALTVSMSGIIGWVGLLVPHIARLLTGAEHRRMMPLCAVLGALGLLLADTCARSLTASEIPLGVVTELFGAVAFLFVLRRLRGGFL